MTVNALMPVIADLDDAQDAGAVARWLLACPHSILLSYEFAIRNRLANRNFPDTIAYFEAELASLRAVRKAGLPAGDNPCRTAMVEAAGMNILEDGRTEPVPDSVRSRK
jgi:hypothetical protein